MSNERKQQENLSGRLAEDLQFRVVDEIVEYRKDPAGEVVRVPVVRLAEGQDRVQQDVLGFLWFSDTEDAAGYLPRAQMAPDSFNSSVIWIERLRSAKKRGLAPTAALAEFINLPTDPAWGQIVDAEPEVTASLSDLKKFAGS